MTLRRFACHGVDFIAFAAGFTAGATGTASDREQPVMNMDIYVKTSDGMCDPAFN
jgi:hypothetical protein